MIRRGAGNVVVDVVDVAAVVGEITDVVEVAGGTVAPDGGLVLDAVVVTTADVDGTVDVVTSVGGAAVAVVDGAATAVVSTAVLIAGSEASPTGGSAVGPVGRAHDVMTVEVTTAPAISQAIRLIRTPSDWHAAARQRVNQSPLGIGVSSSPSPYA